MSLLSTLDSILNQRYEETLDYIYMRYHTYDSPIPRIELTNAQMEEMTYFDAMGRMIGSEIAPEHPIRRRKKVIFDQDPDFVNGLPRKNRF